MIAPASSRSLTTVIFINQLRTQVGQMFGNPETTPGGRALRFYASVRLDVRSPPSKKNWGDQNKGIAESQGTTAKVVKNKVAPPMRKADYVLDFAEGIVEPSTVIDALKMVGMMQVMGPIYQNLATGEKFHGKKAVLEELDEWLFRDPDDEVAEPAAV